MDGKPRECADLRVGEACAHRKGSTTEQFCGAAMVKSFQLKHPSHITSCPLPNLCSARSPQPHNHRSSLPRVVQCRTASSTDTSAARKRRAQPISQPPAEAPAKATADHANVQRRSRDAGSNQPQRKDSSHSQKRTNNRLPRGMIAVNNAVPLTVRHSRSKSPPVAKDAAEGSLRFNTADTQHELAEAAKAAASSVSTPPDVAQAWRLFERQSASDAPTATGSVLGAIALITGSTVGAGILALPEVAAPAGFGPSTGVLVGCWVLLAAQALLLAEVNLGVRAQMELQQRAVGSRQQDAAAQEVVTLRQMAEATLGRPGGSAASGIYLLLSYSLLTAYIAKAAEVVGSCGGGTGINPGVAAAGFAIVLGGVMCLGGERVTDMVNRVLTAALMLLFCAILGFGAQHVDPALLGSTSDWGATPAAVPIIFLSLVYHDLVPVVCQTLGGDRPRIRAALLGGSLLPLVMFGSWDAVMLSLTDFGDSTCTEPLARLMQGGGNLIGSAVQGFSLLALITSFIGTCLGLTSTLQSEYAAFSSPAPCSSRPKAALWCRLFSSQNRKYQNGDAPSPPSPARRSLMATQQNGDTPNPSAAAGVQQPLVYVAALAPPLAIALDNPGAFLDLLEAAGGYGMTLLYGVTPPLMAWQLRYASSTNLEAPPRWQSHANSQPAANQTAQNEGVAAEEATEEVAGGRWMLAALCGASTAVALGQMYLDMQPLV